MLRATLRVAQPQEAYRYLLADSWYASAENMNQVRELGHEFILALPTSRSVALSEVGRGNGKFQALDTLAFSDRQPLRVWLREHRRGGARGPTSLYQQGRFAGRVISAYTRREVIKREKWVSTASRN